MKSTRDSNKKVGTTGEKTVTAYLQRLGWQIIKTNYRCSVGEMDIIAEETSSDSSVLVFIEVKTRRGSAQGTALEAVGERKQARLRQVALTYLGEREAQPSPDEPQCRFDVAEVYQRPDGTCDIRLHKSVF